jgi:hypothetical protein
MTNQHFPVLSSDTISLKRNLFITKLRTPFQMVSRRDRAADRGDIHQLASSGSQRFAVPQNIRGHVAGVLSLESQNSHTCCHVGAGAAGAAVLFAVKWM